MKRGGKKRRLSKRGWRIKRKGTEKERIARGGDTKRIPGVTRVPLEKRPLEILYTKRALKRSDSDRLVGRSCYAHCATSA